MTAASSLVILGGVKQSRSRQKSICQSRQFSCTIIQVRGHFGHLCTKKHAAESTIHCQSRHFICQSTVHSSISTIQVHLSNLVTVARAFSKLKFTSALRLFYHFNLVFLFFTFLQGADTGRSRDPHSLDFKQGNHRQSNKEDASARTAS